MSHAYDTPITENNRVDYCAGCDKFVDMKEVAGTRAPEAGTVVIACDDGHERSDTYYEWRRPGHGDRLISGAA